jgi:hypothetical protein
MSPLSPSTQLVGAFAPAKLRKDGIRLGLVAGLSIVYALAFEQAVVDVLLIGLNAIGVLVTAVAAIVAVAAISRHGRVAGIALAVYGSCLLGHVAALVLLLG